MKKNTVLLLAVLLCVSLAACAVTPNVPTTEPSVTEQPSTEPVTVPVNPTIGGNVTPPNEMPDPPENDYSLPPDERGEVIDR